MTKPTDRREFLKWALKFPAGALVVGGAASTLWAKDESGAYRAQDHYYGMGIQVDKCIGCGRCAAACKTENKVLPEPYFFRTWVERYVIRDDDTLEVCSPKGGLDPYPAIEDPGSVAKSFFVPKMCAHCERSPCEQVCPVGATLKSPDGVVLIDKKYCIGCGYCIQACPYGCRYFDESTRTAGKCTLCYHRITVGLPPACVLVCPSKARMYGNLKDSKDELQEILRRRRYMLLRPELGTNPKCYYIGLDQEVV